MTPVWHDAGVPRRPSVLELCVAGAGLHRGAFAASYVARYAMTANRLGGKFPSAAAYAEDWKIPERTAWVHRQKMRAALGDGWQDVVMFVAGEIDSRTSERQAIQTALPSALAAA